MAFNGFSRGNGHPPPMADINTTPLVDVMLVLLVIFLITAPVLHQAVSIDLPQASAAPAPDAAQAIRLSLDGEGNVFWNDLPISREQLPARLAAEAARQPELHLHADSQTAYQHVARFLAAAHRAGLNKVAFATDPTAP